MLAINDNGDIRSHNMAGLAYDSVVVCCHEAGDDHCGHSMFIQVHLSMPYIQKRNLYANLIFCVLFFLCFEFMDLFQIRN